MYEKVISKEMQHLLHVSMLNNESYLIVLVEYIFIFLISML